MRVVNAILAGALLMVVMVLTFGLDPSPFAILATGCGVLLSLFVHVYAHEVGHLAAALALKFRVTEVTILAGRGDGAQIGGATVRLGLFGARSEVCVAVPPGRATKPRWVAYALAGPATNLTLAAATGAALWVPAGPSPADGPTLAQLFLIASTVTGAFIGLANLIPGTSRRGQSTDGRLIVNSLLRSDAARRPTPPRPAVIRADYSPPSVLAVLRSQVDIGGPAASEAAVELVAAALRAGDLSEDSARLVAVARAVTTPPHRAAFIAATIAEVQATMLLVDAARAGQTHPEPGPTEEIAELAYARDPQLVEAGIALALVRVLQHRPAEARSLLMLIDAGTERSRVNGVAVRAMAEADLGDSAQARRLIDAGRGMDVPTALLRLATAFVDRADGADGADRQRGPTRSLDHSRQPSS
jgi:Zn-dependent protease